MFRARDLIFVLAPACVAVTAPALAATPYDGDWSVVILTRRGDCDSAFRYGIEIDNGVVRGRDDSAATVRGQVARSGTVRVSVQSGSQWADGSGRLGRDGGSGVWQGQGNSGTCSGTWQATRRSDGPYASETRAGRHIDVPGTARAQDGQDDEDSDRGSDQGSDQASGADVASCAARFRSYEPATGTYLGYDGARHPCP
jgi:hypothetical protein